MNPRESKKLDPIAVFYGPMVLAISTRDRNMNWPNERYVALVNGFPT